MKPGTLECHVKDCTCPGAPKSLRPMPPLREGAERPWRPGEGAPGL